MMWCCNGNQPATSVAGASHDLVHCSLIINCNSRLYRRPSLLCSVGCVLCVRHTMNAIIKLYFIYLFECARDIFFTWSSSPFRFSFTPHLHGILNCRTSFWPCWSFTCCAVCVCGVMQWGCIIYIGGWRTLGTFDSCYGIVKGGECNYIWILHGSSDVLVWHCFTNADSCIPQHGQYMQILLSYYKFDQDVELCGTRKIIVCV